jgi:murein DD-endopeptidase MepM/ murein hydrolase activator NlpD
MLPRLAALTLLVLISACSIPRWPVEGPVSSPFGLRGHGFDYGVHRGIDIAVPTGTPIRAMSRGTVHFAGTMSGYGKVVILDHRGGVRTLYAHLSEIHVTTGDGVDGRAVIGLSGATGRVTGPHLHFEIQRHGRPEDPVPLLGSLPPPARH